MFGVTENGDPSVNYEWMDYFHDGDTDVEGAILITKNLTNKFKKTVLDLYTKDHAPIMLHVSCTGYGGTVVEPNLKSYKVTVMQLKDLIVSGFPAERVVLRVDPIIPTPKGIRLFGNVVDYALEMIPEIKRVRLSVMDMYPHVRRRFEAHNLPDPYQGNFQASYAMFNAVNQKIIELKGRHPGCHFETCAETQLPAAEAIGCVSANDYATLKLQRPEATRGFKRKNCLCLGSKKDLLTYKHNETGYNHCYGCLYCYWQTEADKK